MTTQGREQMVARLHDDLIGPSAPDELLEDRPGDRYLTGMLFPQQTEVPAEEDEQLGMGDDEEEDGGISGRDAVSLTHSLRPATAGISFAAEGLDGGTATVAVTIKCGSYRCEHLDEGDSDAKGSRKRRQNERWRRTQHVARLSEVNLEVGARTIALGPEGIKGLFLFLQIVPRGKTLTATAVLVNELDAGDTRVESEERTFFQVKMAVEPCEGTALVARTTRHPAQDEDGRSAALIYRNAFEYAVGHTCSATWDSKEDGGVSRVRSSWLPKWIVPATSAEGDVIFEGLRSHGTMRPLSATWLARSTDAELVEGLAMLPDAYEAWLFAQEEMIPDLPEDGFQARAMEHIGICRQGRERMREAIGLLGSDQEVRLAFRLANKAMLIQRQWARGDEDLVWRPFQLGFLLLTLTSTGNREHKDREVMDLLWFPTGGGKTEAYLALTAFVLFLRRLKTSEPITGSGVAVFMRYTLRLLTIQQFQRAAALILACEYLRRGDGVPPGMNVELGEVPFSIGLWVGGGATPNKVSEARNLESGSESTHRQLTNCPACDDPIHWRPSRNPDAMRAHCENEACPLGARESHLPLWTVDEDIYRERPSLLIGTIDKFAQIARQTATRVLFGIDTPHDPPDLIIQDELHLISGPLGTIAGLYEVAIDELCTRDGRRPKVIGSTATIRRAREQIRAIFDREAYQFPPPCLDADNSCFAVKDPSVPGRLYVGMTTAGRSPKFALQGVCASLLQSASTIDEACRDPYWTLAAYFNSLRELGGALVLMQDDVGMSLKEYASRRGEEIREISAPEELTSRKRSSEIPEMLERLGRAFNEGAYDVLLASNMISVGVDIPRLGLMVVNGQPKGISEYIQATSRIGRVHPGLVVSVYNNGKARDRSHFETFRTWHSTIYREVEATSVTPFASRAQDRALHAVLVSIARHTVDGLKRSPVLSDADRTTCEEIAKLIEERCAHIDGEECAGVAGKLDALLDEWEGRADLQLYWENNTRKAALMIGAEKAAALSASGSSGRRAWPTLNSMREVEPGTPFVLVNGLKVKEEVDGAVE